MIDIHSHIIPEVDDGSPDIGTSLKLVRELYFQGVKDIVCTPHYRNPYLKTPSETKEKFEILKTALEKENVPVNIYLGQEIYCKAKEYKEPIESGAVLTMNGGRFILLEFDFNNHTDITDVVYEVKAMGYIPIVAHIERYSYVTEDDVYEIKKVGGLIQVNADSVLGNCGRGVKKTVGKLFREGFVDFVASDVHSGRGIVMAKAYDYVKKKYGEDAAEVVFNENAKRIIKG